MAIDRITQYLINTRGKESLLGIFDKKYSTEELKDLGIIEGGKSKEGYTASELKALKIINKNTFEQLRHAETVAYMWKLLDDIATVPKASYYSTKLSLALVEEYIREGKVTLEELKTSQEELDKHRYDINLALAKKDLQELKSGNGNTRGAWLAAHHLTNAAKARGHDDSNAFISVFNSVGLTPKQVEELTKGKKSLVPVFLS